MIGSARDPEIEVPGLEVVSRIELGDVWRSGELVEMVQRGPLTTDVVTSRGAWRVPSAVADQLWSPDPSRLLSYKCGCSARIEIFVPAAVIWEAAADSEPDMKEYASLISGPMNFRRPALRETASEMAEAGELSRNPFIR